MWKQNIRTLIVLLFITGCFSVFVSCKTTQSDKQGNSDLISGLASPLILENEWSTVQLSDFVDDVQAIQSVSGPEHAEIKYTPGGKLFDLRKKSNGPAVSSIKLFDGKHSSYIPLFNTTKQKVNFVFNPKGKIYKNVNLVGDINAWNPANTPLTLQKTGLWTTTMYLTPATYGYQIVLDGKQQLDPNNKKKMSNGLGGTNSVLEVVGPDEKLKPKINSSKIVDNRILLTVNKHDQVFVQWNNRILPASNENGHVSISIPEDANSFDRSHLRIYLYNEAYGRGPDLLLPLEKGKVLVDPKDLDRMDKQTLIMYFLMVDRFNNENKNNDRPTDDPDIYPQANNLGGDLSGVIQKLKDGYFQSLGMNTIWLSPIVQNAEGAHGLWDKGGVTSQFSAYHGYWPTSFTKIDDRFGSEEKLKELVQACHNKDLNILLDFIANHVHESHPVYQARKDDGWATDLYLPDGSLNTEKWDEHRLTTWFDVFLPSLNLEKQEVTEMLSDSALYWLEEYGVDGFRHDATKHIPLNFWRTLTKKVKKFSEKENRPIYQVGETYGTAELISSYVSSGMLDGQFDFNVYDALMASICREEVGFENLAARLKQSMQYYGKNHLMGNMSGNQDKPRLMSMATGEVRFDEDSKLAGWTRDIQKQTEKGFQRSAMMHAINLFIPGVPCIYYGDEIGMPGGNDPDNRRMMKFDKLNEGESNLRNTVSQLAKTRSNHMALLYGDMNIVEADKDRLLLTRTYFDETIALLINNGDKEESFDFSQNMANSQKLVGEANIENNTIILSPLTFVLYKLN